MKPALRIVKLGEPSPSALSAQKRQEAKTLSLAAAHYALSMLEETRLVLLESVEDAKPFGLEADFTRIAQVIGSEFERMKGRLG
jgi:hypothetical protein